MFDSPLPLRDYCLGFIRDSIVEEVNERPVDDDCSLHNSNNVQSSIASSLNSCHCPITSSLNSCHLTSNISEYLLESISEDGKLTDDVMQEVFPSENCRLENVRIPDASNLSKKGLRVLRSHRIDQLQVIGLTKATINELIGCLGEYSLNNLNLFNVSRSTFTSSARFCVVVGLAKLRNLRKLDISHTDINHHGLDIIVEDLPHLQSLNISATRVRDLTPLKKMKHRLKSLSMYNLKSMSGGNEEFIPILCELNQLIMLDMSEDRESPVDVLTHTSSGTATLLRRPELFPYLKYLDISGKDGIDLVDLKRFIGHKHKQGEVSRLTFLGLMQTDVCTDDSFMDSSEECYQDLEVTGSATENQILNALRMYSNRPAYIQKSLCYLYNYTINDIKDPRIDMISVIIPVMKKHKEVIGIQMAATACLYNLTKGKVGDRIHPKWLAQVVNATLSAMEHFPNHQQLQKNTLLTLCSDRILQEVTFDRFRCAKLVMESLVYFKDPSMNRMAVAVCSILAAKISTLETSALGAKPVYMETLLHIVRTRVEQNKGESGPRETEPDIMLKFTLSALWNLTDESPSTCAMFLEKGGIGLYLEVLTRYEGFSSVETKILGLLNNIAEVSGLRSHLLQGPFVASLQKLLQSQHIDVSYFAAGIFAHLLSDQNQPWLSNEISRCEILHDLVQSILGWKSPEIEMVAYRSFNPFLPLLRSHFCPEVQLWAVWAIHHVCSKNPTRYCDMLLESGTLKLFQSVRRSAIESNNQLLIHFCQLTVDVIRKENPHLSTELE